MSWFYFIFWLCSSWRNQTEVKMLILRSPKKKPRNQSGQSKMIDPWALLIIRGVQTLKIRKIEEGSELLLYLFLEKTLLNLNWILQQDVCFEHRTDDHGRKEFRERDSDRDREREKERRQREKERLRRQDEERRRRRERQDGENSYRKREVEGKKEKERAMEQKKGDHVGESSHSERPEKTAKDHKKEESAKRERLRNKVMILSFRILQLLSEAFLR